MVNKVICEVCGEEIDTRGLRMHMESHKLEQVEQKVEKMEEKMAEKPEEKVKEVEIKPEKDVVEKTKEVKTKDFNSCGECGQTFKGFPNYCPKCGAQFE